MDPIAHRDGEGRWTSNAFWKKYAAAESWKNASKCPLAALRPHAHLCCASARRNHAKHLDRLSQLSSRRKSLSRCPRLLRRHRPLAPMIPPSARRLVAQTSRPLVVRLRPCRSIKLVSRRLLNLLLHALDRSCNRCVLC